MNQLRSAYSHEKIRLTIEEQGRLKSWVADQVGITPSHLSRLITGERPITSKNAERFAEVLGVPVAEFETRETAGKS